MRESSYMVKLSKAEGRFIADHALIFSGGRYFGSIPEIAHVKFPIQLTRVILVAVAKVPWEIGRFYDNDEKGGMTLA